MSEKTHDLLLASIEHAPHDALVNLLRSLAGRLEKKIDGVGSSDFQEGTIHAAKMIRAWLEGYLLTNDDQPRYRPHVARCPTCGEIAGSLLSRASEPDSTPEPAPARKQKRAGARSAKEGKREP